MLLDLKKIKRSGKDSHDFFFQYQPQTELVDIPSANLTCVEINGTVTLTGDHSALVQGEVVFTISGECTRCLKETEKVFNVEFAESVEQNNPDGYQLVNDTVNLAEIVDDVIAVNVPINFLCKEDCKGLCVCCGVNLNDSDCKCKNKQGR